MGVSKKYKLILPTQSIGWRMINLVKQNTEVTVVTRAVDYAKIGSCWSQYLKRLDEYLETNLSDRWIQFGSFIILKQTKNCTSGLR